MQNLNSVPQKTQYTVIAMTAAAIVVTCVWALAAGSQPRPASEGFLGAYGAIVFVFELLSAILLFSQFRMTRMFTFAFLSMAYAWVALLAPFQAILLADGFADIEFINAASNEASWLWSFWHLGFPVLVTVAMSLLGETPQKCNRVFFWSGYLFISEMVIAAMILAVCLLDWLSLPQLASPDHSYSFGLHYIVGPLVILACLIGLAAVIARGKFSNAVFSWLVIAMLAMLCEVIVAIYSGSRLTLGWYAARVLGMVSSSAVVIALLIDTIALHHKVIRQNEKLHKLATTDKLTQLANRRELDDRLFEETARGIREHHPLSLIIMDIDHFKKFNDTHGHVTGDRCLQQVSTCITRHVNRHYDLPARYGGEEFAILLPDTSEDDAFELAEDIRREIVNTPFQLEDHDQVSITASLGVASLIPTSTSDAKELVKAADAAMYQAKKSGRNQVQRPDESWQMLRQKKQNKVRNNIRFLRRHAREEHKSS